MAFLFWENYRHRTDGWTDRWRHATCNLTLVGRDT